MPLSAEIGGADVLLREKDTHGGELELSVGPDAGVSVFQVPGGVAYHVIFVPTSGPHTFTVSVVNVLPADTWTSMSAPTVTVLGGGFGADLSSATVTAPTPVALTDVVTPVVGSLLWTVPVVPFGVVDEPVETSCDVGAGGGGVVGDVVVVVVVVGDGVA